MTLGTLTCEIVGSSTRVYRKKKLGPRAVYLKPTTATCEVCFREFTYLRGHRFRKYCSEECTNRRGTNQAPVEPRPCRLCGQEFTPSIRGRRAQYCSKQCRCDGGHKFRPFVNRVCKVCGGAFQSQNTKASICGRVCHLKISAAASLERSEVSRRRRARVCKTCQAEFVMRPLSGKGMKGLSNEGQYCSVRCRSMGQLGINSLDALRVRFLGVLTSRRECEVCQTAFVPRGGARACSQLCRDEFARRRARDRHYAKQAGIVAIRPPRTCPECDRQFIPQHGAREFCSPKCLKRAHKRTRKIRGRSSPSAARERVDPYKVFYRDGWRCQLCGEKTLKKKRGTIHPRAPELDHIVPLSRGGSHTYRNTQCACRACNQKKSDGAGGQLRLFG